MAACVGSKIEAKRYQENLARFERITNRPLVRSPMAKYAEKVSKVTITNGNHLPVCVTIVSFAQKKKEYELSGIHASLVLQAAQCEHVYVSCIDGMNQRIATELDLTLYNDKSVTVVSTHDGRCKIRM